MLSSVLRSARAVEVNIAIMRTFVQVRRLMDTNRDLARKIEALEEKSAIRHRVRSDQATHHSTRAVAAQNWFSPIVSGVAEC